VTDCVGLTSIITRDKCRLQEPARSPSEELISGEIIFRDIRLVRLKQSEFAVSPPSNGGADAEEADPISGLLEALCARPFPVAPERDRDAPYRWLDRGWRLSRN
jgi:hypothetical protein